MSDEEVDASLATFLASKALFVRRTKKGIMENALLQYLASCGRRWCDENMHTVSGERLANAVAKAVDPEVDIGFYKEVSQKASRYTKLEKYMDEPLKAVWGRWWLKIALAIILPVAIYIFMAYGDRLWTSIMKPELYISGLEFIITTCISFSRLIGWISSFLRLYRTTCWISASLAWVMWFFRGADRLANGRWSASQNQSG